MSRASLKFFRLCVTIGAAILITLLFAVPLLAQQAPGPPGTPTNDPNDPVNQDHINKTDMRNREFLLGNARKPIRRAAWGPDAAAIPKIKDDFERLQLINNELMIAVFAKNVLDPKQIGKATSDIAKRATRLMSNLAYPKPDEEEKTVNNNDDKNDIRLALSKLDTAVMSVVNNPIFQIDRQVVNTQLAMKVTKDLTTVVRLSDTIRRQAQDLEKAQTRP